MTPQGASSSHQNATNSFCSLTMARDEALNAESYVLEPVGNFIIEESASLSSSPLHYDQGHCYSAADVISLSSPLRSTSPLSVEAVSSSSGGAVGPLSTASSVVSSNAALIASLPLSTADGTIKQQPPRCKSRLAARFSFSVGK